jgi:hypothetical protein
MALTLARRCALRGPNLAVSFAVEQGHELLPRRNMLENPNIGVATQHALGYI